MKTLDSYIEEGILNRNIKKDVDDIFDDVFLETLKKYAWDNLKGYDKDKSAFNPKNNDIASVRCANGEITLKTRRTSHRGQEIRIDINNIKDSVPQKFNIKWSNVELVIRDSNITTLDGIFTPHADVHELAIYNCPNLKDLKGCPQRLNGWFVWNIENNLNIKISKDNVDDFASMLPISIGELHLYLSMKNIDNSSITNKEEAESVIKQAICKHLNPNCKAMQDEWIYNGKGGHKIVPGRNIFIEIS